MSLTRDIAKLGIRMISTHVCRFCKQSFPSRKGLLRHQRTNDWCTRIQEEVRFQAESFEVVGYDFRYNPRKGLTDKIDPPILLRAKQLGVEWFESPSTFRDFYLPIWYLAAWKKWPEKVEAIVRTDKVYTPIKGRYRWQTKLITGQIPGLSFDQVMAEALKDTTRMGILKMRVATDTMHVYATSSAPHESEGEERSLLWKTMNQPEE